MKKEEVKGLIEKSASEVMKFFMEFGDLDFKEEIFEDAFVHELRLRNVFYDRQYQFDVIYKGYKVGQKKPDCIIYPEGRHGKKCLVEMKAVKNVTKAHRMQTQVYLLSLDLEYGFLLNFNKSTKEPEIEEIEKPLRELKQEIVFLGDRKIKDLKEVLFQSGKEVVDYLGYEFLYYGTDIYVNAVGVELRLRGWNYYTITHPLLYKGHAIMDYPYDYVFDDGSVGKIFVYEKDDDIEKHKDEFKKFNHLFGVKKGFILAIPGDEGLEVKVEAI